MMPGNRRYFFAFDKNSETVLIPTDKSRSFFCSGY